MGPFFHKNKPHPWYHGQHVFLFLLPRCKILPPKKSLFVSFQASKEKEFKFVEGTNHLLPSQCHKKLHIYDTEKVQNWKRYKLGRVHKRIFLMGFLKGQPMAKGNLRYVEGPQSTSMDNNPS
jgi:hypothetical protein